jgi:hypothetical protein
LLTEATVRIRATAWAAHTRSHVTNQVLLVATTIASTSLFAETVRGLGNVEALYKSGPSDMRPKVVT